MALPLTVAGVVIEGLDRALMRLRSLLAIYWLPWLIGTTAVLIVDILWAEWWPLGDTPAWAANLVWAPCIAMAYVMLVRLLIFGQAPKRAINLDFSRETAWAVPLVTMWYLATVAVKAVPFWAGSWMAWHWPGQYGAGDLHIYLFLLRWVTWITVALLPLCFFGLIVLTVMNGRPDWREHIRMLRAAPLRLAAIALLARAASYGVSMADARFWDWVGAPRQMPMVHPWRLYIRDAVFFELTQFPLYFVLFALEVCLLAEAYRRLIRQRRG